MTRASMFACAALLTLVVASSAAADVCPVSELQFNGGGVFTSADAAFDTVAAPTKELAYDVVAGTLELRHDGKFSTFVRVIDTFQVLGAPFGTPVLAVLELAADGEVSTDGCGGSNCWGYIGVRAWTDGAQGEDIDGLNVFAGSQPAHPNIGVPILFLAGHPKTITMELGATGSADHRVTGQATFRFSALTGTTAILSCRGYTQGPTPAIAASWGGVKAAYR